MRRPDVPQRLRAAAPDGGWSAWPPMRPRSPSRHRRPRSGGPASRAPGLAAPGHTAGRPTTVKALRERLKAAVCTGSIKHVRSIAKELGPHARRVRAHVRSTEHAPRFWSGIDEYQDQEEYRVYLGPETTTAIAVALGVRTDTIAKTMEDTLLTLDEEARFEEMATLVRYLILHLEIGLVSEQQGTDVRHYRPASAWRLEEVNPKLAAEWTAIGYSVIDHARLQRVRGQDAAAARLGRAEDPMRDPHLPAGLGSRPRQARERGARSRGRVQQVPGVPRAQDRDGVLPRVLEPPRCAVHGGPDRTANEQRVHDRRTGRRQALAAAGGTSRSGLGPEGATTASSGRRDRSRTGGQNGGRRSRRRRAETRIRKGVERHASPGDNAVEGHDLISSNNAGECAKGATATWRRGKGGSTDVRRGHGPRVQTDARD